jgi:hypothetical protein
MSLSKYSVKLKFTRESSATSAAGEYDASGFVSNISKIESINVPITTYSLAVTFDYKTFVTYKDVFTGPMFLELKIGDDVIIKQETNGFKITNITQQVLSKKDSSIEIALTFIKGESTKVYRKVAGVYHDSTVSDAIMDLFSQTGSNLQLEIRQPDNTTIQNQIFVPNLFNFAKCLAFINENYGLYKTKMLLYTEEEKFILTSYKYLFQQDSHLSITIPDLRLTKNGEPINTSTSAENYPMIVLADIIDSRGNILTIVPNGGYTYLFGSDDTYSVEPFGSTDDGLKSIYRNATVFQGLNDINTFSSPTKMVLTIRNFSFLRQYIKIGTYLKILHSDVDYQNAIPEYFDYYFVETMTHEIDINQRLDIVSLSLAKKVNFIEQ